MLITKTPLCLIWWGLIWINENQFNGKATDKNGSQVEALTFSFQTYFLHPIIKSIFKALKVPVIITRHLSIKTTYNYNILLHFKWLIPRNMMLGSPLAKSNHWGYPKGGFGWQNLIKCNHFSLLSGRQRRMEFHTDWKSNMSHSFHKFHVCQQKYWMNDSIRSIRSDYLYKLPLPYPYWEKVCGKTWNRRCRSENTQWCSIIQLHLSFQTEIWKYLTDLHKVSRILKNEE